MGGSLSEDYVLDLVGLHDRLDEGSLQGGLELRLALGKDSVAHEVEELEGAVDHELELERLDQEDLVAYKLYRP